jgi:hypothetical protein
MENRASVMPDSSEKSFCNWLTYHANIKGGKTARELT